MVRTTQSVFGSRLITLCPFLLLLFSPSVFAQSSYGAWPGVTAQSTGCATSGNSVLKGNGAGGCSNAVAGTDYVLPTTGSAVQKANGSGGLAGALPGVDFAPATSGSTILKGNSAGGFSSTTAGIDYAPATSGASLLKANGSGGFSNAAPGIDYAPITVGTTLLKGNGAGGFASATSGTDYAPPTSGSSLLKGNSTGGFGNAVSGMDYAPPTSGSGLLKGNGSGGFSAATSGIDFAPATSSTAILKGNGSGGFSNAVSGSDYAPPSSGTLVLKGNGAGGFAGAVPGTDYLAPGQALVPGNNLTDVAYSPGAALNLSTGCGGLHCFYVDSSQGIDSNSGTLQAPWQTFTNVQSLLNAGAAPGTWFLFRRGQTWSWSGSNSAPMINIPAGTKGTPANPIVFTTYGLGAPPVFDGNNGTATACVEAIIHNDGATALVSYVTVDGIECRNTSQYGVVFYNNCWTCNGSNTGGMPGIVVQNMNIHNTGPGCYQTTGTCTTGTDDLTYKNALQFVETSAVPPADGTKFLNNLVHDVGGHNAIELGGDAGAPQIIGNTCYGWVHNCIDSHGGLNMLVKNNVAHGPPSNSGEAFYYEQTAPIVTGSGVSVTWIGNIAYNVYNAFACESGVAEGLSGTTYSANCRLYNNTVYVGNGPSGIVTTSNVGVHWDVRNNIFDMGAGGINVCPSALDSNACGAITTWDYNDYGGSTGGRSAAGTLPGMSGMGTHDLLNTNPLYGSTAAHAFYLSSGSPCTSAGLSGLTSNPNIGAF
jgi:hypothetical protein